MSDRIVLRVREPPASPVTADCVRPDLFAGLDGDEIRALPLWIAGERRSLGDLFDVEGERAERVRIEGDAARLEALGQEMASGSLEIVGDAGRFVGRAMRGGAIHVHGNVGDGAGSAAPGASKGMRGGEIIVRGSAGAELGARMRRGLIAVCGNVGPGAGRAMLAGTLVALGDVGPDAMVWTKRGTLIATREPEIPRTFRHACIYRPLFVSVLLRSLRTRYAVPVREKWIGGRYRRCSGDLAELGRGEILHWVAP